MVVLIGNGGSNGNIFDLIPIFTKQTKKLQTIVCFVQMRDKSNFSRFHRALQTIFCVSTLKVQKTNEMNLNIFFYSNRQDYHGGSSATNLNVAGPFPVLSPAPHHHHHHIAGPQGAVQQVAIQQVAGPEVASPIVASPQVAGPEVAIQQVASPLVAIPQVVSTQVAGPQVAVQHVARHQVPGLPVGGHHITGHQAAHYPVPRYSVAHHPVTNHLAAGHPGARFKRSPQFYQRFSAGAQRVNCQNGGCFQTQQVQLPVLTPIGFPYKAKLF